MYGQQISAADQRVVMQTLRDAGVATVGIDFSGGNDEGGTDGIEYLDADGGKVDLIPTVAGAYETRDYNRETQTYGPPTWVVHGPWVAGQGSTSRPATDDEVKWAKVAKVLEAPIYDRWGSFAGEFYVQGELTWDVAKGTHELHGQEEVSHWESF